MPKHLINELNVVQETAKKSPKYEENREKLTWKLRIDSENNFPTAAGLASSAAGYACLVYTLASLYGIQDEVELSALARVGSGSACRSIFGGFVQWQKGNEENGSDSIAVQLAPESHWPEMEILILVVNDRKKTTSSTSGMSRSVDTSPLLKHRVTACVPERIEVMKKAIADKDFKSFAELTMQDSNQFHAVCLDTYPPCVYLNDTSHLIINAVHKYNEAWGTPKIAYTFDAGPNACIFLLKADVGAFVQYINKIFPNSNAGSPDYIKGIPIETNELSIPKEIEEKLSQEPFEKDLLKYMIHTKVGPGPRIIQ